MAVIKKSRIVIINQVLVTSVLLSLFTGTLAAEDFNLSYDFRFRYEYTDDSGETDTRTRNRIRTRLGANYSASKQLDLFVRFASAEENTASAEQTLGTGFTVSDICLLYTSPSPRDPE